VLLKENNPHKAVVPIVVLLLVSSFFVVEVSGVQLIVTDEYNRYVHTNFDSDLGNYTLLEKPIFPVLIANTTIPIGGNWTITCPLQTGHKYHVYCYGTWVNTSSTAKTDYDIYVFNPQGALESSHTEAAGLPEHLGTTSNDVFFTPQQNGNYSFVVKNDARESQGSQQATFMIIENLETDQWCTSYVEGKASDTSPHLHTCWSYEFITNESKVELYVKVPPTLDMYEARLYLMNTAESLKINDVPLPWEPGLYGNQSGAAGGYNFESEAYRGVAYASCEYMGQSMFLNYTATVTGIKLYHLVLIGEEGSGTVEFMLKTQFGNTSITPVETPSRMLPNQLAKISYVSNNASLATAQLTYTTDSWNSTKAFNMDISNHTCNATVPGQPAGTLVQYRLDANDTLNNALSAEGNYTVKNQPSLNFTVEETIVLGQNLTITGTLTHCDNQSSVTVKIFNANNTESLLCPVLSDGSFTCSFQPSSSGNWSIVANSPETQTSWSCGSSQLLVTVKEPPLYVKYSLYIIIGLVAASAAGGVVWFLKFRGK
jgi:hypothetical protein